MKHIYIALPLLFFVSCNTDSEKNTEETIVEVKTDTLTTAETENEEELIDSSKLVLTDLNKLNLFGAVKTISTNEVDIDENGEEYGMGGSYEYLEINPDGFQILQENGGCCGSDNEEIIYKRNENNLLTHRIFKSAEGGEEIEEDQLYDKKEKYFYDDNGVLVKIKVAGFDQVLTNEITFKFDDNNRVIKKELFNVSKNESTTVKYDYSDTQTIETYFDKDGELDYKIILIFNEQHLLTTRELHLSSGDVQQQKFTYKFDEQGNWTSKETKYRYILKDGTKEEWRSSSRTTRTIKYY